MQTTDNGMDHVDDFKLPDFDDDLEQMKRYIALAEEFRKWSEPRNWWDTGLDPKVLFEIARDDGIPVVEVPPSEVLLDLAAAPDRNARMAVLLARKQEIVDQCKAIILNCDDPWVADESELAGKAIAAYEDGHQEAAMALAVSVSEPLAIWSSTAGSHAFLSVAAYEEYQKRCKKLDRYKRAAYELSDEKAALVCGDGWEYPEYRALIAPIPRFFTAWYPDWEVEPPESLSRHVVAHQPTRQHFSPENALLSLMLATSLLCYQQSCFEGVRSMDESANYYRMMEEEEKLLCNKI